MPRYGTWALRIVLLAFLVIVLNIGLAAVGNAYTSTRFPGLTAGMTRAQVDRHLWAFTRASAAYNGMAPTNSAASYAFLWFGKMTEIMVIFDANGVVVEAIPSFNN